jgi:hypothetical protein
MPESKYITYEDIKAKVAEGFDLTDYLEESDSEVEDLAEKLGVRNPDDIETDPLHYKIKRYAVVFVLMRLCQDKIGSNSVEIADLEKYTVLYNMYSKELQTLRSEISIEMVTGQVNEIRDRAVSTGTLFRG